MSSIAASGACVRAPAAARVAARSSRPCARAQWRVRSTDHLADHLKSVDHPPEVTDVLKTGDENPEELSELYTDVMQQRMGSTTLTYRHEDGTNYCRILDDLIVGSCLQTVADVDKIADGENVRTVMCLQEDSDMAYFELDINPILERCAARGDVHHMRHRIRDFDPFSLRMELPGAVAALAQSAAANGGTAYVHCTAGLGRAPATSLAYMWWFKGWHLEDAYDYLTGIRPCKPNVNAIRCAAADVLYGEPPTPVPIVLPIYGIKGIPQVAGLDVGWGQQLDMKPDPRYRHRFLLMRDLPPGTYSFKFIIDGRWGYAPSLPTRLDGDNTNNWVGVPYRNTSPEVQAARERLLAPGGRLTDEERQRIQEKLMALPLNGGGTTGNLSAVAAAE
ncbi:phosphoglucan phosphatase amyloplastic [Micractinium conductrix]|uniref:Phosphoglucan phosphatase amyloplastic n=1 Tax=Micractinium conductrix TaxID=554055 RepID=A0A2P6VEM5_9CHLO|nr:phosphoglucan phosphatase amyloplastic [Micractinium conductrix]|eukprot:PSC72542.1 phosphoglucan phosphatase amyloplastic [Micractinium conductrix]